MRYLQRDKKKTQEEKSDKMWWNKKDNSKNIKETVEKEQTTKKKKSGSFDGVKDLSKMLFKKRDYKIEKREITKEDKKAAIITACIIIGIGLLLWFLPFTHKFFEDFLFLRV